jgi:hypothetical protein
LPTNPANGWTCVCVITFIERAFFSVTIGTVELCQEPKIVSANDVDACLHDGNFLFSFLPLPVGTNQCLPVFLVAVLLLC